MAGTVYIVEQCDFGESFGESLHSACSEPYYYESAYNFEHRPSVLVVDMIMKCMKVQTKWFTRGSAQACVNRSQNLR